MSWLTSRERGRRKHRAPTTLRPLSNTVSTTWSPLMTVYQYAFTQNNIYAAAATSIVIAVGIFILSFGLVRLTSRRALGAGGGALVSAALSGLTGYALAKYRFRGRALLVNMLLAGVLVPGVVLAIPQYLLLAKVGLTNTYWPVLLPSTISPFGIYLGIIYANAAVPDELIESARIDGAARAGSSPRSRCR